LAHNFLENHLWWKRSLLCAPGVSAGRLLLSVVVFQECTQKLKKIGLFVVLVADVTF